ncbi:MAG: hypothetical protein IPL63_08460 [Saprospiraceae bacterium]|nr:hypothetical protein [Saprospiraceae bacterium]MBK6564231.1 hypothetical protein [Saprospiraceae bacterium]MBK8372141.1 hypothetical protein [Saprospiraceae bacterium]MBK8547408.1 hypothetical protein [Saprospiraceae bacterium]MBK8818620.1 hypothetical protein [Saprospiraceae bacterium]
MKSLCHHTLFLFIVILMVSACSQFDDEGSFDIGDQTYQLAIPLVNTSATIKYLAENATGNVSLKVDQTGKATLFYNGEVLRRSMFNFFPPYPGTVGFPIPDTLFSFPVPFKNSPNIKKAVFRDTKLNFYLEHNEQEDVTVKMVFLNLFKNNKPFEQVFSMPSAGNSPSKLLSERISVDGYEMRSTQNDLNIYYEAIKSNGEKIVLDRVEFYFDVIKFAYLEGYIGYHISPVSGSLIDINLFDKWISGTFDFENPKVSIIVDNSFGFPVRSKVNRMELTSITGNRVNLESEFVQKGVDFNYPFLNEIGKTKTTYFSFDRNNSNIRDIFNEKTKTIEYDISAEINAEKDTSINGFADENSYYVINVAAEVPLHGSVNDLVVTDTVTFDPAILKGVEKIGFKMTFENTFPMDLSADIFFLDASKNPVFTLINKDKLFLPSPGLDSQGRVLKGVPKNMAIQLEKEAIEILKKASFIAVVGKINSLDGKDSNSVWMYDNNGLLFQLGALIDYKK